MRGADPEKKKIEIKSPRDSHLHPSSLGCEVCRPGPFPTALGLKAPPL